MDKPYTIEELVEAAETVVGWYLEEYEISEEMQNRLNDFFRWVHSKEPKNIKPLAMENYNEIPLDQKEALNHQVKELRKVFNDKGKFKRMYASFLIDLYNGGIADALGGVPAKEENTIVIGENTIYETTCPHCGKAVGLDLKDLTKDSYLVSV